VITLTIGRVSLTTGVGLRPWQSLTTTADDDGSGDYRGDLATPRMKTPTYGPRSFATSESTRWNSLPQSFRDTTPTLGQFQRRLKTSLFCLTVIWPWLSIGCYSDTIMYQLNWTESRKLMQFDAGGEELRRVRLPRHTVPRHAVESPTIEHRQSLEPTTGARSGHCTSQ